MFYPYNTLFMNPIFQIAPYLFLYIGAAVLPAVLLMRYIYRMDTVESEPPDLLMSLLLRGVLAALCSMVLEMLGSAILPLFVDPANSIYPVILAFFVVAVVEEGTKLFFLKKRTWDSPAFNYRFDAIVYSAFVSLGFAAFENVQYVFNYGLSVALPRALLAIPGHLAFSVAMGVYYSHARYYADRENTIREIWSLLLAWLVPVALHGFYDACALVGSAESMMVFLVFVVLMFLSMLFVVRRESQLDRPY